MNYKRTVKLEQRIAKFERQIACCKEDLQRPGKWQSYPIQHALRQTIRRAENQIEVILFKIKASETRLVP